MLKLWEQARKAYKTSYSIFQAVSLLVLRITPHGYKDCIEIAHMLQPYASFSQATYM